MSIYSVATKLRSFAIAGLLVASTATIAQTIKWDMTEAFPPTSISGIAAGEFARLVKEKTGGKIEITVHYSGSLGLGERDILTAVEQGVVPLSSTILDKILSTMPLASVQFIPFMAGNLKDGRAIWAAQRPFAEAHLAKLNQVLLFETFQTPVGMWSRKPVQDLATLKTLKLRTNNPNTTKTFQNAGASPTFMAWGDVPPALSTGVIDSVITTCESGLSARFYEQMKNYTRLDLEIGVFLIHIHKPTLDKLSPELKRAVLDASAEASKSALARTIARLDENSKAMKANGVTVWDTIPAEFRGQLQKAGSPLMEDWKRRVGADVAGRVLTSFEQEKKKGN
jgi:TRAP-type C4-dicarboxylate transport system substrate-binding protein